MRSPDVFACKQTAEFYTVSLHGVLEFQANVDVDVDIAAYFGLEINHD